MMLKNTVTTRKIQQVESKADFSKKAEERITELENQTMEIIKAHKEKEKRFLCYINKCLKTIRKTNHFIITIAFDETLSNSLEIMRFWNNFKTFISRLKYWLSRKKKFINHFSITYNDQYGMLFCSISFRTVSFQLQVMPLKWVMKSMKGDFKIRGNTTVHCTAPCFSVCMNACCVCAGLWQLWEICCQCRVWFPHEITYEHAHSHNVITKWTI